MNKYQHPEDMPVAGLNGHGKTPLEDQIKSYQDEIPDNSRQCDKLGSRLNLKTGELMPKTSKAMSTERSQFGSVSPEYLNGYDAIVWGHCSEG